MQRKILVGTILIISAITIYIVGVWEPNDNTAAVSSSNIETTEEKSKKEKTFKVDKDELIKKLSKAEKKEINKILKNISVVDMGKIDQYMSEDSGENDFVDVLDILKKRLVKEDYKRIREILEPYVDLSIIG